MSDQMTVPETGAKSKVLKIVRWVVVTAGALLVLFTFAMAIYRKYGG